MVRTSVAARRSRISHFAGRLTDLVVESDISLNTVDVNVKRIDDKLDAIGELVLGISAQVERCLQRVSEPQTASDPEKMGTKCDRWAPVHMRPLHPIIVRDKEVSTLEADPLPEPQDARISAGTAEKCIESENAIWRSGNDSHVASLQDVFESSELGSSWRGHPPLPARDALPVRDDVPARVTRVEESAMPIVDKHSEVTPSVEIAASRSVEIAPSRSVETHRIPSKSHTKSVKRTKSCVRHNTQRAKSCSEGARTGIGRSISFDIARQTSGQKRQEATTQRVGNIPVPQSTHGSRRRMQSDWADAVWEFLEDEDSSPAAKIYMVATNPFIVLTVLFTLSDSLEQPLFDHQAFLLVEIIIDSFFCFELAVRYYCYPTDRRLFLTSLFNCIDMSEPFVLMLRYFVFFHLFDDSAGDTVSTVLLCVVPITRLLRCLRRFQTFHLISRAFWMVLETLPVLFFTLAVIALVFSSLLFLAEPRENIATLPIAMWLTFVTLTTVGIGDVFPESSAGHLIVCSAAAVGVLYIAMPLGIIGHAFDKVWNDRDRILVMNKTRERLMMWGYTAMDIPLFFEQFCINDGTELELDEFRKMMAEMDIGLSDARIVQLFQMFDSDGSGSIDDREFVLALFPADYNNAFPPEVILVDEEEDENRGENSIAPAAPMWSATTWAQRLRQNIAARL